ncbi:MAG: hypothetical protein JWL76_820 [Thermoleophilia bacterium]|nr:hypothetical protein [Thermoleophilia bacterium]
MAEPAPQPTSEPDAASIDDVAPLRLVAPVAEPDAVPGAKIVRTRSTLIRVEPILAPPTPRWVAASLVFLYVSAAALGAHQALGWWPGSTAFFSHGVNNVIFVGAAVLTMYRAVRFQAERLAWWTIAIGLTAYCLGDVVYSVFYADTDALVTPADALYLAFMPCMFAGIVLLVRSRISTFELDRWIDGIAAALLVSAPAVVLVLAPIIKASEGTLLVKSVSAAYPLTDIVLLGAVVGVIALAGWHPGRAWFALALGLAAFVAADSFYSVENLTGTYELGAWYEFMWPLAGLLIATSAWLRPVRHGEVHAWGWRAIALPVLCQIAPMVLMFLKDEPASEQLLMTAVLAIVLVQLVVSRPRRPAELA